MLTKKEIGLKGELLAARYLESKGLKLLEKNWRCEVTEADIIALDGDTLVVVEVKTRTSERHGAPEEAVDERKQEKMIEAAEIYLELKNLGHEVRFDIIAILLNQAGHTINHIQSAF
jgi:putative endonuclease